VIVVPPAQRTEEGLLALANQLWRETKADRNAFIYIYDDHRAALLRDKAIDERLSKADMKWHDDHFIGSYFRNINTGYHKVTIHLQGINGDVKAVPLQ